MKCLETRRRGGVVYRRIEEAPNVRYTTAEVPVSVLRCLGAARLKEELQRFERRLDRLRTQARAKALLAEGWKPDAVALEVGRSPAMVRRYRQRMTSAR